MRTGFRELEVWQQGRQLVRTVYTVSASIPDAERFGLVSQLRRAVVSVPCNVAEGWGRNAEGSFAHFLRIARGSLNEVETLLVLCADLDYIPESEVAAILEDVNALGRKIYNLIEKVKGSSIREEIVPYEPSLLS
ncbi:MAG: four helix bundle protein [Armatimonadetes bacterium]|nr:four helix bundle protein [Armatimonadota bacterium]